MRFLIAVMLLALPAAAEEGMWTFDNPPLKLLQAEVRVHPHAGLAGSRAPVVACA